MNPTQSFSPFFNPRLSESLENNSHVLSDINVKLETDDPKFAQELIRKLSKYAYKLEQKPT